jgi:glycosyltransferase involved in cell wall biosynthesis
MRVAMIDPALFTWPYDRALVQGLMAGGHDVTLHSCLPEARAGAAGGVRLAGDFYRLANRPGVRGLPKPLRLAVKGLDHAWSMLRLLRRLRRERPDVIHLQWLALPVIDQLVLRRLARVAPLVLTVHDTNPFNGNASSWLQRAGHDSCHAAFSRLIVHTAQGRARLLAQGVAAGRIAVLPHGLLAPATPDTTDAMTGEITFLLFGQIKPYKGADVLIRAFASLPADLRAQARVRIVGRPQMDLAPLQALAAACGRVDIEPGFIADDAVAGLFAPGTVAVFPYREIEASGVLFVALAHGRPVVASRLGSFAESLVDGVQGHLVPPDDVASLATALAHLITDRAFAAHCARAAGRLARSVADWPSIACDTASLYRDAIADVGSDVAPAVTRPADTPRPSRPPPVPAAPPIGRPDRTRDQARAWPPGRSVPRA